MRSARRLEPGLPLPPYAYVPRGPHPHPTRDADGHSFARAPQEFTSPDPRRWEACTQYRYGIDLFNHGYYWEAHEVWEGLWHACGRRGPVADFLKALIALAAAGVKQREPARGRGPQRHAARCLAVLDEVADAIGHETSRYLGLELGALRDLADRVLAGGDMAREQLEPGPAGRPTARRANDGNHARR